MTVRILLEHGFSMKEILRGDVGLDEAMLLNKDRDKLVEAIQDAGEKGREKAEGGRRKDERGYLEDEESWD